MKDKKTNKFVEKSTFIHEGRYTYERTKYINSRSGLIVTCPVHGDFEQSAQVHLRDSGCMKCFNADRCSGRDRYRSANERAAIIKTRCSEKAARPKA